MANKKKTPLHLVKVVEDRWFAWTIALVVVILLGLSGYVAVSNYRIEQDMDYTVVKHDRGTFYKDAFLGFVVRHPVNWAIEKERENVVTFVDPQNYGESVTVSVFDEDEKSSVLKSFESSNAYDINLSGDIGRFYTLKAEKATDKFAVVVEKSGKLFLIKGNISNIQQFLSTFRIIPPII